jgi:hypothetical protein
MSSLAGVGEGFAKSAGPSSEETRVDSSKGRAVCFGGLSNVIAAQEACEMS